MAISSKNKIEVKKFEKIIYKLDTKIFHIYRKMEWIDNEYYIIEWGIYDKRVPSGIYWNDDYKPTLCSKDNTIKDLKHFVKENANATINTQLGGIE